METILDFPSVFLLKILSPYSRVLSKKSEDSQEPWKFEVYQSGDSGILNISFPHTDKKLWHFQIYCPEEWNEWKCLSSPQWETPRQILSNASATTFPQITRMTAFNVGKRLPAFLDFSLEGINMIVTSFLWPSQKILDQIQREIVSNLDKKL